MHGEPCSKMNDAAKQGDEHSRCHSWCGSPPFSILAEGRRKAGTMMETLEQRKNNLASEKTLKEHLVFWKSPLLEIARVIRQVQLHYLSLE